jgi:alkylhydroperoxidase family enzyme
VTLADLLQEEAVPFETLHERYGSLLELVRTLIGVVPNCDPYLEIWPTAFRSYNVMVPNLLNLPLLIWGMGAPRSSIGLAMYVSSRASGCPYCSAHACSFALRRGATVEQVMASLEDDAKLAAPERSVARVAAALGVAEPALAAQDRAELQSHYSPADVEWIVLAIAMMGWLNKAMNGLGIPLEMSTVQEVNGVIAPSGWTPGEHLREAFQTAESPRADSFGTKLGIIRHAPAALSLDKRWTAGVPDTWPAVGHYLREKTGHDFPVLSQLRHKRALRAIATMLRDNLGESVVGHERKLSAGLAYAETVGAKTTAAELAALGARRLPESPVELLARALAPSPTQVDAAVIEACRAIPAAGIVETVAFVSLLQMLQRLQAFYA